MPILIKRISILLLVAILSAGCGAVQTSATPSATLEPTPVPTSTPAPMGDINNPLVIGLVSDSTVTEQATRAEELASSLTSQLGFSIQAHIYPSYSDLVTALQIGAADAAFLPPLTYLLLSQNNQVEVALLTNHYGVYAYGAQFIANSDSNFSSFFDPTSLRNTAPASTALTQFSGMRPCWVDPHSASGFIVPLGLLKQNNISVQEGAFTQSHTASVRALYIKGICDFGVTFAISGDPRTSSAVTTDLTDALDRIKIIWQTDAVIPSYNFSFQTAVPVEMRSAIVSALQTLAQTEQGRTTLTNASGYQIQDLKVVDDSIYTPLRDLVTASQLSLDSQIGW